MDLDEFAVAVFRARLKRPAHRAAGAGHRHRRAAENQPATAGGDHDRIGRKGADFHRHQILPDAAAANAVVVEHRGEKIPELVFGHLAFGFPAAHLFVEGVEQLLTGGGAGEGRALEERAAEAALIAKALGRAVEGHAEAVHEVDDPRTPIDHLLHRRLMIEKIAAVDRVVEDDSTRCRLAAA